MKEIFHIRSNKIFTKFSYELFNFKCVKDYFLETAEESLIEPNGIARDDIRRLDAFNLKSVTK